MRGAKARCKIVACDNETITVDWKLVHGERYHDRWPYDNVIHLDAAAMAGLAQNQSTDGGIRERYKDGTLSESLSAVYLNPIPS